MPGPGCFQDAFEIGEGRFPAQVLSDFVARSNKPVRIAGSTGAFLGRDGVACDFPCCFDNLPHAEALPVAQIVDPALLFDGT